MDVIEIDGASNRGIEEIRTLRENVKYAPARGRYKVYIIDEVHQLTEAAFNALLTTLEEPPSHVVFILATTAPRDIPATVLSRVQRFDFRPIAPDALTATLEGILREEAIPFEPGVLPVIVRAAEGSLRDALSLLDTAIAYGDGRLETATTAQLLGVSAPAAVGAFVAALLNRDTAAALETIDRAVREGEDLVAFARDVVELLRLALVLKAAPTAKLADLTPAEGNELRKLGEPGTLDEILYVARAFLEADARMRESPHPRVELEIATVRATRRPAPQAIEDVLRRVDEAHALLRQQGVAAAPASPQVPAQASLLPPAEPLPPRGSGDARRREAPPPARAAAPPPSASAPAVTAPVGVPAGAPAPDPELSAGWDRVVEEVMRKRPTLGTVLTQARPGAVSDGELTIVLTGNHFHREMLADTANRELVVQAVRRHVAGADRINLVGAGEGAGGVAQHPVAQAAIAEVQGEVVAVRPRLPEGEDQ